MVCGTAPKMIFGDVSGMKQREIQIERNDYPVMAFTVLRVAAVYIIFVSHAYLFNNEIFKIGVASYLFSAPAWACIWVLFTLSGFLTGRNFKNGKYIQGGVGQYYYRRMTKIWIPAILFVLLFSVLCRPNFIPDQPNILWEYLFCTYRGTTTEFTAMWFAFTIMMLYYISPLAVKLLEKLSSKKRRIAACILFLSGLIYRITTYCYSLDYLKYVYYPLFCAADLYCFGLVAGYNSGEGLWKRVKKPVSTSLLIICFLFGFYAVYQSYVNGDSKLYNTIYSYLGPSLFSVATVAFLVSHDNFREPKNKLLHKVICWLAKYSFEYYMIHSYILSPVSYIFQDKSPLTRHILILSFTFAISMILSIMFHLYTEYLMKKIDMWLDKIFRHGKNLYWKKIFCLFFSVFVLCTIIYLTLT